VWTSLRLTSQFSHTYKSETSIGLHISVLIFSDRRKKHFEMKSNERSLRSIFSNYFDCYNFDLLASLANIFDVPNVERLINFVYRAVIHSCY
jgi:hypothetical protein